MLSAHRQTDSESFFRQSPVMSDNAGVVSIKTTVAVTLTHDTKDIHDSQTYIKAATQAREKAITNIAQTGERPAIIRRLCDRDHGATDVHLEDYVKFLLIPPLYSAVTPV